MSDMMCEDQFSTPKERGKYMIWTKVMDSCLLKVLAENVIDDYKGGNIIKTATYNFAVEILNKKFGYELNKDHLKNHMRTLRQKYSVLREILSQKGFKWDKAQKMVVANDAAWKKYIKVNPEAKHFHLKPFENYDELERIFGNHQVLGTCSYVKSEDGLEIEDNCFETSIDRYSDEKPKAHKWTEEMDTCLGNVLAEQIRKGYKMGNVLHTAAYEAAVESLNMEFGLGMSKSHIKNRLKTWKKQYGILNGLLSHGGFRWDETQRMIVGDDSLWTEYIQRNPEAKSLRGRCIWNYSAMLTVVGKRHTVGRCSLANANADVSHVPYNEDQNVTAELGFVPEISMGDMCEETHRSSEEARPGPLPSPPEISMGDMCEETRRSSEEAKPGPLPSPPTQSSRKRCSCDRVAEMMREVAANIGKIADTMSGNCKSVCLDELFEMVKRIPGFDDDLIIDACEFLSADDKRVKVFLILDNRLRKQWLVKRLRS